MAIARWKKVHAEEKQRISNDKESSVVKAAICGFLAGDGYVQKRKEKSFFHYQIDFFPDDKIMRDAYTSQVKEQYGKSPSIKKNKNFYSVRISSRTIFEDLNQHAKFGLMNWRLPKDLMGLEGAKRNWLRAFFSAEAYVNKNVIRVQTINEMGMREISKLLDSIGIKHKYYEYNSKIKSESRAFIINISCKESRLKFYRDIGFWHGQKSRTLKEALGL